MTVAGPRCPLCKAASPAVAFEVERIPVCRCAACGFTFAPATAVIATRGTDAAFYSLDYFGGRSDSGYAAYAETAPTLERTAARQVSAVLAAEPDRSFLLEIGSGGGHFLRAAAPHFDRVAGVEICEGVCEQPLPPNVTLFERPLEAIGPDELESRASVIVLWDVIEHLADPRATIELLGRLAAPHCVIVLSTGNVASLLARVMGRRWRLMTPLEHYSWFAPTTITRLLEGGGFVVERISSPWKWVPVCLIVAQLGRMAGIARDAWRVFPSSWRVPVTLGDVMLVRARRR